MGTPADDKRPIGVLIMDDAVFGRDYLRELLDELPEIDVTSSAASLAEARAFLVDCGADLVLVSPHQLDPSGDSIVRAIRQLVPSARVVVLGNSAVGVRSAESVVGGADAIIEKSNVYPRICELLRAWFGIDAGTELSVNPAQSADERLR